MTEGAGRDARPPLLEVRDLRVSFSTPAGEIRAVDGISYRLEHGRVMGIVGESGSGKSVGARAILGLIQPPGKVVGGSITFEGEDVLALAPRERAAFRGGRAAMIFQNPMTSLNPVYPIGSQLAEALRAHDRRISRGEAARRAAEMLDLVGISNASQRIPQHPNSLSVGMRQRVMIAMALICRPRLLIADEPTTALDVTIQAQILALLKELQEKTGMGILFITHNLGVVAEICQEVSVMYGGRIVEQGPVDRIFYAPGHPYTVGLLRAVPRVDGGTGRLIPIPGAPAERLNPPGGCPFAPRCEQAEGICLRQAPPSVELGEGHRAACWLRAAERENPKAQRGWT